MSIKAISFDFWNTLFREQPGAFGRHQDRRRSLLAEAVCAYREVSHSELDEACQVERASQERIWQEQHRTPAAADRVNSILSHRRLFTRHQVRGACCELRRNHPLDHPPVLVEGAREILGDLSRRYRLGIISDVGFTPGRVLKLLLGHHGLIEFFDSLVFSDEAGRAKPHTEVFERTARVLGAKPETIVHVGDLERTDIVGAKQAGYRAIRFTGVTPMHKDETTLADFVTTELKEVPRLVGLLGSP